MSTTEKIDCKCTFVGPNRPMHRNGCLIHPDDHYKCDDCQCPDYRPRSAPTKLPAGGYHWPRCVCGHIAQAHN